MVSSSVKSTYIAVAGRCECSWQLLASRGGEAGCTRAAPAAWGWEGWSVWFCTLHCTSRSPKPRTLHGRAGAAMALWCPPRTTGRRNSRRTGWQTQSTGLIDGLRCRSSWRPLEKNTTMKSNDNSRMYGVCLWSSYTTLFKLKVLYRHRWFHEEPLTFKKTFQCTKVLYRGKMVLLII